jgi:drug/metabolite transporter (DMT)-like permease
MLLALTILWGSAFLFTKLALDGIPPSLVVVGRLAVASALLVPLALLLAPRLPRQGRLWLFLGAIALFGNALPFSLITWGQGSIDSGLAGILMAIMPLATLSLAHFLVPGERLTRYRIGGFLLGFAGVVVLMGPDALLELGGGGGHLLPMLAVLGGAVCYAVSAILARLRPASDALSSAAATTFMATLMITPFLVGAEPAAVATETALTPLLSVVILGVFSTAVAAIIYFRLVKLAGPSFVSQLNYLIPLWAVVVGVVLLGERPEPEHLLALILILGGVLMAQLESRRARGVRAGARRPGPPADSGSREPAQESGCIAGGTGASRVQSRPRT